MENASKALIIAGAILLAIVIISLGLVVVNNSRGAVDNANLSEQEIQTFNSKFLAYKGDNVSGARVNSLIQLVMATNQATIERGDSNFVCIGFPTATPQDPTKKYVAFCNTGNGKPYTGAYAPSWNLAQASDPDFATKKNQSIFFKRQNIIDGLGKTEAEISYSLSVLTGKTYKVELGYRDGSSLILGIIVTEN